MADERQGNVANEVDSGFRVGHNQQYGNVNPVMKAEQSAFTVC